MKTLKNILVLGSLFLGLMVCAPAFADLQIESIQVEIEGVTSEYTGEGEVIIAPQPGTVILPAPTEDLPNEQVSRPKPVPAMRTMRQLDALLREARTAEEQGNEEQITATKRNIDAIEIPEGTIRGIPAGASIEARTGQDVANYYKVRVGELMREEMDTEARIAKLTELRGNVDTLIEELIQSKDEITSDEMEGLVEEIRVKPNWIEADNIKVQTTAKKIMFRIREKPLQVRPTAEGVVIKDEDIEVNADEITIKSNGVVMVGTSEVKITPSQIMVKIGLEAQEIELTEEEDQAVYKIKTQVRRKLFGFIPINVAKNIVASAVDAEILEEKLPWWSFLTSK